MFANRLIIADWLLAESSFPRWEIVSNISELMKKWIEH